MMHITRFALVAALTAGLVAPTTIARAQGAGVPAVAIVFPHRNVLGKDAREPDGLSTAMTSLIGLELSHNPGVRVIDREQMQKLAGTVTVDRETAMRIGAMVGAQKTVYGSFSADATGNLRIDVRAVDVASGHVEYTDRLQDRTDAVMPLVHHLVTRLTAGLGVKAVAGDATAAPALPLQYVLMYGRALDLADHGDAAGARELLGAVLESYPAFSPATTALARLR